MVFSTLWSLGQQQKCRPELGAKIYSGKWLPQQLWYKLCRPIARTLQTYTIQPLYNTALSANYMHKYCIESLTVDWDKNRKWVKPSSCLFLDTVTSLQKQWVPLATYMLTFSFDFIDEITHITLSYETSFFISWNSKQSVALSLLIRHLIPQVLSKFSRRTNSSAQKGR